MKILFLLLAMIVSTNSSKALNDNMVWLESGGTKIGVLISHGGRVVYLSRHDSPNLLKSDPSQWNESESEKPEIGGNSDWKEYNGHIVWIGPQSEWWNHQEINAERKKSKVVWPPDPFMIYGTFKILENSGEKLIIQGPVSEISGLSLKKTIEIDENGDVSFEVEATNMRKDPVSWDLWLNTRVSGYAKAYVPVKSLNDIRIDSQIAEKSDTIDWIYNNGYFSYIPESPEIPFMLRTSKAYITPSENWIAAFIENYCFKIEFPETDPEKVHPDQAVVEIYNRTSVEESANLTELEYHTEFKTFQPGESFKTNEKWIILKYEWDNSEKDHTKFLNMKMK